MIRALSGLIVAVVLFPSTTTRAEDKPNGFFFKPGDRIVFLGDSITEQYQYSTDIELYLTTRFPKANFTFLNAGIGGDTANGGAGRFAKHVLDEKPTAVTINFGMNDAGYGTFNVEANKTFVARTTAMLEAAKKAGVRVALISPNAVDRRVQVRFKQYLETQKEFYAPLKEIAAKFDFPFVDQYAVTRAALEKMEMDDPMAKKVKPFGDGFHTDAPGGLFMAHAILTGLHAPAEVSSFSVTVKDGQTMSTGESKCKVTGLAGTSTGISFTRLDEALPMPVQPNWVSILPYVNELKDLNAYGLRVTGLEEGSYSVLVDGVVVANYPAKELAAGVNLGLVTKGPIWEQGNKVFQAINDKNRIVHGRFRGIMLGGDEYWSTKPGQERKQSELKLRLEQITAAQTEIDKLAQPVERKFEIRPAK